MRHRPAVDLRRARCGGRRARRGLLDLGIGKGDRVGIWAPNCAEWMFVQYATAKIGAILVNINPAYRTHELEYVLNQSGDPHAGRGDRSSRPRDYAAMVDEVRGRRCPELGRSSSSGPTAGRELVERGRADDAGRWPSAQRRCSPDDPINIQYTSGTTGFPKGATLVAPQHPQQRLLRRRAAALHRARPHRASRCPSTTASAW